ncbi:hypothetical protein GCM10010123_44850 [Pilimelia anulata]|uniref:Transposase n=1 Tax=Pilimelia anulata TaxID=53371 RepID=A0A8J3BF88_9ACTN|nr:transposase [Pilimelia anulata]GGK09977.1 hypothetical protein GCM10010123_44850 [Pilimelia anulata]
MPRSHPPEFRAKVVAAVRRGEHTMRRIARDHGISESCLYRWVREAVADSTHIPPGQQPGGASAGAA